MRDSPFRLTALIVGASLLVVIGFLAADLRAVYARLFLLSAFFVLVVVGVGGMFWLAHRLRNDVLNGRWSEETLAPFREVTGHILWNVGLVLLIVAMFAALTQDRHHRTWFWVILFLLQTQTQLTAAFARPRTRPTGPGPRLDWRQVSPLRSEHWGER